jgi:branched-chain amino acid transport system substrate-binding protein
LNEEKKMKARNLIYVVLIAAVLLASCAPAAAPTAAPAAPAAPAATTAPAAPAAAATTAPAAAATTAPAAPAAATTAPAAPAATTGEIKIAILAPLSGPVPTFGVSTRDGALLAIKEWNAKGGVLGAKITPVVEDSQCTPDPAVNAANKVIDQDKVHYIVGEVCSSASIPVSEIANAAHVLQISPTSTNPSVTVGADGKVKPYIFRACFIDPFQGQVAAKFALTTLKYKTAFVMQDQSNDYVKGLAEFFTKYFTDGGGKIVGNENYTGKDTDFSTILAKVADAKPDMVYLPDYYNVVNLVTKQAKEKGITATFMGGDGWDSSDLDLAASDGGYYTNHYSAQDTRPEVQNWVKAYGAEYKDDKGQPKVPDALATLAYDATNMLLTSIQTAGADDASKVKDSMAAINFNGVSGKITFDANHDPIKSAAILHVTGGKVVFDSTVAP